MAPALSQGGAIEYPAVGSLKVETHFDRVQSKRPAPD